MPDEVEKKIKSHKTIHQRKLDDEESTKMELEQIASKSKLLRPVGIETKNAWQVVFEEFLEPNLSPVWRRKVIEFRIQELRTRDTDKSKYLMRRDFFNRPKCYLNFEKFAVQPFAVNRTWLPENSYPQPCGRQL